MTLKNVKVLQGKSKLNSRKEKPYSFLKNSDCPRCDADIIVGTPSHHREGIFFINPVINILIVS